MLQIKPMTIKDEAQVMEMVRDFYHSDAVDHVVGCLLYTSRCV